MVTGVSNARDPIVDLRRIAFLLERANEATYRVRAFRSAATALAGLPAAELSQRADAGTLTELAGVGEVTARCVAESLAGEEPVYLRRLLATEGTDLDEAAAALRAALRGDCHTHSDWSDGGSPIEEMALAAVELGHEYLVLTDHSPRLTVARGLTAARLRRQLDHVAALNAALPEGFRILTGIEVDILPDGSLDQSDELLDRLDASGRYALLKLATGGMRIGVSGRLAKTAFAQAFDVPVEEVEEYWHGLDAPYPELFAWAAEGEPPPDIDNLPAFRPFMLAHPLEETVVDLADYAAEWKWDGIRVQLVRAGEETRVYSRSGDDISATFPELLDVLPFPAVLDGELLVRGAHQGGEEGGGESHSSATRSSVM